MACNLDEDIKYFIKKQKDKIQGNLSKTGFKECFHQHTHSDKKTTSEDANTLSISTYLFSQS
ncbi:hypothetical protein [uncultured Shewanella sp.]|uniref:hypothetical protein n=1 Tax=uncultured Shewanella sp. TaxID=173975 RepID=UPI0026163F3E|nr:hypothetical protein [uncultured Shewanella sp.]